MMTFHGLLGLLVLMNIAAMTNGTGSLTTAYVGNLPLNATEPSLEGLFSPYGTVLDVNLVTDQNTGRSKGFAFIEFQSKVELDDAIANLNGKKFYGKSLVVSSHTNRSNSSRGKRSSDTFTSTEHVQSG